MKQLRKQSEVDMFKTQSIAKEKEIEQFKREIAKLEKKKIIKMSKPLFRIKTKRSNKKQEFVTNKAKYEDAATVYPFKQIS